eukprot:TRINITY_DN770_c0_g1_i6.p1 TRINITY_DN770_c0_g1~~TRINITY_DN770_c0_g1_i6.p1  ORF type:complete len:118 (-),score=55.25 TRINITY_DN770_c0_g1_i6:106-414(-)
MKIADDGELSNKEKISQLDKLYQKQHKKRSRGKLLVCGKNGKTLGGAKKGRVTLVDRRMKKDKRGRARAEEKRVKAFKKRRALTGGGRKRTKRPRSVAGAAS